MATIRFFYGFVNGLTLPLSYVVVSEIIPKYIRGTGNIFPVFSELIGRLYTLCLGFAFIDNDM